MKTHRCSRSSHTLISLCRWVGVWVLIGVMWGCTTPGAVAPSTLPIRGEYVEMGPADETTSCGYAFLGIPFSNPDPLSEVIDSMVQARGGDALVNVTSHSDWTYFLIGSTHCFSVRGTVVRFQ